MTQDALPDDLPFLTEIVSPPPAEELPLLTEIVGSPDTELDDLPLLEIVAPDDMPLPQAVLVHDTEPFPENLPPVAEPLTEAVAIEAPISQEVNAFTSEEISYLLLHIEEHLSTIFTNKLNSQLEQLQRLAVELAVSEFKAELPQLLRDALAHHKRE
ncbi:MAG: hypothetical protein PHH47_03575 [Gallionella sp.]|nr:hypothetical protein [Gallionella sp.]MDD4946206.1 hypothetical protein [Gallionella sp.]MDD5613366.1 hypothetical protein [Gallionella sp.]